jgi:hypothetical protein
LKQELEFARRAESWVTSLKTKCERIAAEKGELGLSMRELEAIKTEREENTKDARLRLGNLFTSVNRSSNF